MTPPGIQTPLQNPTPSAAAHADAAHSSLDSQIDALLSSSPDRAGGMPEADTVQSATQDAEAAVASIEAQVESLVDQFVEKTTPEATSAPIAAPSEPPEQQVTPSRVQTQTPESISELDDQLASLTDELLTAPEPVDATTVKFAPTPEIPAQPAQAPSAPPPAATAIPAPAPAPIEEPKPASIPFAASPARPSKLVRVFAKPLAGKPRLIRDTVGWLGFNSMFLAGVVWIYHLWFQRPEKPVAQHAPAALVSSDGHGETPHAAPPAAEHDAPAGGDAHASAEHDADEPITGVQPLHKKKPTYALSDAMAERLNVAKKSEAGGHGAEKKSGGGHGAPAKAGH